MKKGLVCVALLSCFLMAFAACFIVLQKAHAAPPSDIKLRYDLGKRLLLVTISHDTTQDRANYIKFIEIKKNGLVVSINTYSQQPEGKFFTYQYRINAMEDDTLQAVVTFNKSGVRTSPMLTVTP